MADDLVDGFHCLLDGLRAAAKRHSPVPVLAIVPGDLDTSSGVP
eukprot:CAMPEP_0180539652 /NCGR_PEP_ID=MMETSP1036_2-20121128/67018_1 /TAXON_ID=632150 /ORGANISM="Azadinium spinosum, Strain 3D9" /LENGTH=43 /DNA_ID= /DNA_START= /DNA_END= /DNA_ORIENTATION=